jgi:predicted nucleic acid-binding protein
VASPPFLDANVLIRHFTADNPGQSPRASAFLTGLETGELRLQVPEFVVFETIFTLERSYRRPKAAIRENVMGLLELPTIILRGKRLLRRAFDIYVEFNISFGDAYDVALMEQRGVTEIVSFDRDFDRVAGITRIEP